MLNKQNKFISKWQESGQSLVETALFLPIFLVILAGVVEVSQFVITSNRLTTASRATARYAANGGEDAGMGQVLTTTVFQTMDLDEQAWDAFSIRGTINGNGDGFVDFDVEHIYGVIGPPPTNTTQTTNHIMTATDTIDEVALQQRILNDLKFDDDGNQIVDTPAELGDVRIVGTYVFFEMDSLLNLDATAALAQLYVVESLSVMRLTGFSQQPSEGCSAFPIAVKGGVRAVTPPNTGAVPFPSSFDYPVNAPNYFQFVRHNPAGILDDSAQEGTLFLFTLNTEPAPFKWLQWNDLIASDPTVLANSLQWPGNSLDFTNQGDAGTAHPDFGHVVRGYAEPGNVIDIELHENNVVRQSPYQLDANITFGTVNQSVNENVSRGRDLRLIVFDDAGDDIPGEVKINRFGIFTIRGYGNAGTGGEWVLLEFVRWDDTCGKDVEIN